MSISSVLAIAVACFAGTPAKALARSAPRGHFGGADNRRFFFELPPGRRELRMRAIARGSVFERSAAYADTVRYACLRKKAESMG
jgi:hypothetical protein